LFQVYLQTLCICYLLIILFLSFKMSKKAFQKMLHTQVPDPYFHPEVHSGCPSRRYPFLLFCLGRTYEVDLNQESDDTRKEFLKTAKTWIQGLECEAGTSFLLRSPQPKIFVNYCKLINNYVFHTIFILQMKSKIAKKCLTIFKIKKKKYCWHLM
jgi:Ni,Fe-hydrogenase I small subunit